MNEYAERLQEREAVVAPPDFLLDTNAVVRKEARPWKLVATNIGFIVIAVAIAYWVTVSIGVERVREVAEGAGVLGALAVVLLKMTTIIVVPLGGGPIYPIAGAVYGFWKGFVLTFIGDTLGFTVAFFLSRWWGRSILYFFVPHVYTKHLEKILERSGEWQTLIKARVACFSFPEIFAYAAGLTSVSFPIFIVVTMALQGLWASLLVGFGDVLLSGNLTYIIIAGVVSMTAAIIGGWWLHKDLVQEN